MARNMVRSLTLYALLMILSTTVALTEEDSNKSPKKVKCKDKSYPSCYHEKLNCPEDCPRKCYVDCASCQAVCSTPPPSPPPPPPKWSRRSSPSPPTYTYNSPPPPSRTTTSTRQPPSPPPPATKGGGTPPSWLPPPPPAAEASEAKKVRCRNKNYIHCYGMELTCPSACPEQCEVDCVTCSPVCNCNKPGAVCQDPRFVGGDGITFYFHGKKDADFCLVSDLNLHINAHFIGKRNPNLTRDFTWVQSLGILFDTHKLCVRAQKTSMWNDAIDRLSLSLDGDTIPLPAVDGATWQSQNLQRSVTVSRIGTTNSVEVEVEGILKIRAKVVPITEKESRIHNYGITEEDCFAHLDLSFRFYALSDEVEGVLGRTYGKNYVSKVKMGVAMPVVGGEREFAVSSLFAVDCAVARFGKGDGSVLEEEFEDLKCATTGIDGRGVVCKR